MVLFKFRIFYYAGNTEIVEFRAKDKLEAFAYMDDMSEINENIYKFEMIPFEDYEED